MDVLYFGLCDDSAAPREERMNVFAPLQAIIDVLVNDLAYLSKIARDLPTPHGVALRAMNLLSLLRLAAIKPREFEKFLQAMNNSAFPALVGDAVAVERWLSLPRRDVQDHFTAMKGTVVQRAGQSCWSLLKPELPSEPGSAKKVLNSARFYNADSCGFLIHEFTIVSLKVGIYNCSSFP